MAQWAKRAMDIKGQKGHKETQTRAFRWIMLDQGDPDRVPWLKDAESIRLDGLRKEHSTEPSPLNWRSLGLASKAISLATSLIFF